MRLGIAQSAHSRLFCEKEKANWYLLLCGTLKMCLMKVLTEIFGGNIIASSFLRFEFVFYHTFVAHPSQLYRPAGEATHEDPERPDIWVDIAPSKNCYVVTFSPLLSAALGCNTVDLQCTTSLLSSSYFRMWSRLVPCVRASPLGLFQLIVDCPHRHLLIRFICAVST